MNRAIMALWHADRDCGKIGLGALSWGVFRYRRVPRAATYAAVFAALLPNR
jgi:hypothetical protein